MDKYLVVVKFNNIVDDFKEVSRLEKKGFTLRHLGGGTYEGFVGEKEYDHLNRKYGCQLKGIFK